MKGLVVDDDQSVAIHISKVAKKNERIRHIDLRNETPVRGLSTATLTCGWRQSDIET